jgi:hypothetical protein
MIAVFIFYIHVVFLVYIFTKDYIEDSFLTAFLSAIFIVIIFSVGWTLSEFIMALFMEPEGLGLLFPRAAFSLMLLTILEAVFYKFYFSRKTAVKKSAA